MVNWRATDDLGWRELGWGMFLGGAILFLVSIVVDATVGIVASAGIAVGGLLGVAYAATHADPSRDRGTRPSKEGRPDA